MLTKEPGTRAPTPWHQDQPYYNVEGEQNCSMWIAVDPVRRHSTLEFVAGSHRGPWLMPRSFMDQQAKWFPEGSLADLPDIDAHARRGSRILGWEIEPGDVVCFHMLALHAVGRRRRRPAAARVLGALPRRRHAPCAARAGSPRPSSRAWPTSCRPARRWTTRCSRCCGSAGRMTLEHRCAATDGRRRSPGATAAGARASCWPGRRATTGSCASASPTSTPTGRSRPSPACERWFAVLEGAGVRARACPMGGAACEADGRAAALRGEDAPACELLDGPTRDLNLMVPRAAAAAATCSARSPAWTSRPRARLRALFSADALTLQIDGSDALRAGAPSRWSGTRAAAHGAWRIASRCARLRAWWMHVRADGAA